MNQTGIVSAAMLKNSLTRLGGQRFCTEEQPTRQRLEWLKEVIGREYANVDITPPAQTRLYNDMFIYPWQQGLRLSPIQSNAITLERLPREPESVSQDCYFAVLLTAGEYKLEQGGREVFLKPGEMSLYDATEPHRITIPQPFSKILISIPRTLIDERVTNISQMTATRLPTQTGIAAITAAMIQSTVSQIEHLDTAAFQSLSDPVLEMLTMTLVEQQGNSSLLSRHRSLALMRIKRFIANHLSDTALNTEIISRAVALSPRYINNLFNEDNTSLMRYLTKQRLACSRHYLATAPYAHLSITDIAMRSGFNNMAHFSRVFHQTYGVSPRDYRLQQQHNQSSSPVKCSVDSQNAGQISDFIKKN